MGLVATSMATSPARRDARHLGFRRLDRPPEQLERVEAELEAPHTGEEPAEVRPAWTDRAEVGRGATEQDRAAEPRGGNRSGTQPTRSPSVSDHRSGSRRWRRDTGDPPRRSVWRSTSSWRMPLAAGVDVDHQRSRPSNRTSSRRGCLSFRQALLGAMTRPHRALHGYAHRRNERQWCGHQQHRPPGSENRYDDAPSVKPLPPMSDGNVPSGPAGAGSVNGGPGTFFPGTPLTDSVE